MACPNTSASLPCINWQVRHVKPLWQNERLVPSVICPNPLFYLLVEGEHREFISIPIAPTDCFLSPFFPPTLARPHCAPYGCRLSCHWTKHRFYGLCSISQWWRTWKTRVIYTSLFSTKRLGLKACGLAGRNKLGFGSSLHCKTSHLRRTPTPLYT